MKQTLAINGGIPVRQDPFSKWPIPTEQDAESLLDVLWSGDWWHSSFGCLDINLDHVDKLSNVAKFQHDFAKIHGCKYGIAGATGSSCLDVAVRALELSPGDEIIVPAYSFITTATCVLQSNLVPIFSDIDPNTYNIKPESIERLVTSKTRAIIVVHFAGQMADMDPIVQIAQKYNLVIIEDSSHAHGASYKNFMAGSIGQCGVFSFQASKNMTAGEGGCIVSNGKEYADKLESLIWAGRRQGKPWYEHYSVGWNNRLTEFQGVILKNQLEQLSPLNEKRNKNARLLNEELNQIPFLHPLCISSHTTLHSYHLYVVRYKGSSDRLGKKELISAMQAEGIPIGGGYGAPLYKNPVFTEKRFVSKTFPIASIYHDEVDYRAYEDICPHAEHACKDEALWLPQNLLLGSEKDICDIAEAFKKVIRHYF